MAKYFLIASLFSVAIITHFTVFPFVVGKIIFFRIMVELAVLFYLLSVVARPALLVCAKRAGRGNLLMRLLRSLRPVPCALAHLGTGFRFFAMTNKIVLAVTIFVVIFSLAGFLGVDPINSFWSNYVRGEGIFQMWHYYAFFILLVLLLRDEKDWRRFLAWFLIAGGLSLLLGIIPWLQAYQVDTRFKGAIGNPAFTATYLLFGLFFSLYLLRSSAPASWRDGSLPPPPILLRVKLWKDKKLWRAGRTIALVFSVIISLSFLFLAGTRGALLGLAAGAAVAAMIILYRPYKAYRSYRAYIISGILFLTLIFGFLFYFQPARQALPARHEGVSGGPGKAGGPFRIFQISFKEQTAQTRLWTWQSAVKGWRDRPMFGWGPENFSEVFDKYYDKRHGSASEGKEVWFDRAHNVFMDYLAETGILGLLAYLGIWMTYYYSLKFKSLKFKDGLLFGIFPVVYLVQGSLLFETLPAYVGLFTFLGLANYELRIMNYELRDGNHTNFQSIFNKLIFKALILILILVLFVFFYLGSFRPLKKATLFNSALSKVDKVSSVEEFKNNFSPALNYWSPYGQQEELRMLGGVVIDLLKKNPSPEVAAALVNYLNENYADLKKWSAQDYYIVGRANELVGNKDSAEKFYKEGREKWPLRPEFELF